MTRQINSFTPMNMYAQPALKERSDFKNINENKQNRVEKRHAKKTGSCDEIEMIGDDKNRVSYLNIPIKKIWESDWTLLIP